MTSPAIRAEGLWFLLGGDSGESQLTIVKSGHQPVLGRFERGGSRVAPVFGEPVMIFCALYLDREYIQVIIGQE